MLVLITATRLGPWLVPYEPSSAFENLQGFIGPHHKLKRESWHKLWWDALEEREPDHLAALVRFNRHLSDH